MAKNIIESLQKARWDVAFKTFGSSHSTLIGILVDWWITYGYGKNRHALEEGCTYKFHKKGKGSKRCDAVLVESINNIQGIIEVEGSSHKKTIEKMYHFFKSSRFKDLKYAIFLAYPTTGSARNGFYFDCEIKEMIRKGKEITKKIKNKNVELVMLFLEKKYEAFNKNSLRSLNNFYKGTPYKLSGVMISNGFIRNKLQQIWPKNGN